MVRIGWSRQDPLTAEMGAAATLLVIYERFLGTSSDCFWREAEERSVAEFLPFQD